MAAKKKATKTKAKKSTKTQTANLDEFDASGLFDEGKSVLIDVRTQQELKFSTYSD